MDGERRFLLHYQRSIRAKPTNRNARLVAIRVTGTVQSCEPKNWSAKTRRRTATPLGFGFCIHIAMSYLNKVME